MEKEVETVETVKEVTTPEGETKEVTVVEKQEPKVELTEEEAKVAAENVKKLMQLMDKYKSPRQRQEEKLARWKEEYENMSDDNYKKKQLESKIALLDKKVNPNVLWDSSKGTYVKSEHAKEVEKTITEE